MSDLQLPLSVINNLGQMGFPLPAVTLAYEATASLDKNVLAEWILTHEDIVCMNNETQRLDPVIEKLIELGFTEDSAKLAKQNTQSDDPQTLIEWILTNDPPERHSTILPSASTTDRFKTTTRVTAQRANNKLDNTLFNELLKLGFGDNDIENCFTQLNIHTTEQFNPEILRNLCIDWLITNSQKKAQSKANEINRSRKQPRIPTPINLNNSQTDHSPSTIPKVITNNFLKQVHLSSQYQATVNDEQEPELTREEVIIADIHNNFKRQSWTIYNLDQLNLIQKHIKVVARVIDRNRQNNRKEIQAIQPTTMRQTKKVFTLADLNVQDGAEPLEKQPGKADVSDAARNVTWDRSLSNEIDRTAARFEYRHGENYRQLVTRLIQQCHISLDNHKSIIRAIFAWITNHIRYDIKMSPRDNSLRQNTEQMDQLCQLILSTQSAVCSGYSILFKRMCQHLNIQVDYVEGYTKLTKSCINDVNGDVNIRKLAGHAWTVVHLDGKAYFTDATWSAASWSSTPNGRKLPSTDTYLLVPPEHSIYLFRPHNDQDQHLAPPWTIPRFIQEPCFFPYYFKLNLNLEDRDTEWYSYRLRVERNKQKSMTKSFRVTTDYEPKNGHRLTMLGAMYWSKDLSNLAEGRSQLENKNYEHKLDVVGFEQIDLSLADNHFKNGQRLLVGELNNIPIYPRHLNINQIQYGLLEISISNQSNERYEPIFNCVFEFE